MPGLLWLTKHNLAAVRIVAFQALAQIGKTHESRAAAVVGALAAGLADKQGVVKIAAMRGLGVMAGRLGKRLA